MNDLIPFPFPFFKFNERHFEVIVFRSAFAKYFSDVSATYEFRLSEAFRFGELAVSKIINEFLNSEIVLRSTSELPMTIRKAGVYLHCCHFGIKSYNSTAGFRF